MIRQTRNMPIFWLFALSLFLLPACSNDEDTNPCSDIDCSGYGVCVVQGEDYSCTCDGGYTGKDCDQCAADFVRQGDACVPDYGGDNPIIPPSDYDYTSDGDQNPDGDQLPDGDNTIDGDSISDGDSVVDGDVPVDGDTIVDGDLETDGDSITDGDNPIDGDSVLDGDMELDDAPDGDMVEDVDSLEEDVDSVADKCRPNPCSEYHRTVCVENRQDGYSCECDSGYRLEQGLCLPDCTVDATLCQAASDTSPLLVSANGFSAIGWNKAERKADTFLEHIYRNWDENVWTRDLLYDSYFGLRYGDQATWLNSVAPDYWGYVQESGIIHIIRTVGDFKVESFYFSPWSVARPAMTMVLKITSLATTTQSVSAYSLHNYHLGYISTIDPVNPDALNETMTYDVNSGAYFENGIGGALVHLPLSGSDHHACTPDNPYQALLNGQDLADTASSGLGSDRVAGFQKNFTIAPGESAIFSVATAFDASGDSAAALQDLQIAYSGHCCQQALDAELEAWENWRKPIPEGMNLSPEEEMVYRQSEAVLRMGQVRETSDLSFGQILASMPPGNWNICWMRDMTYAIIALVQMGHWQEARDALAFVLNADSGYYQDYSGTPYQVTITRYFGRGKEETDSNENGPNIEYDGFGLFLWALAEYLEASGDTELLTQHWTTIRDEIAGALLALLQPNGMIAADSSIWEVHWNGQQKQYSYTSLTAANGLCRLAPLVRTAGYTSEADSYEQAAATLRQGIRLECIDNDNVLASSIEELESGSGYYDVATVEAFNWPVFNPTGDIASATFNMYDQHLKISSGRGYFRNDDGGWYDSQEWVFVDLRASRALRRAGQTERADDLLNWITAQGMHNQGMISELHEPSNGTYEGEYPMVGFGAGAYILALFERAFPSDVASACGQW